MNTPDTQAACPSCNDTIDVQDVKYPGEILNCASCHEELEVESLSPVTLSVAPEAEEDWGE